jgi:hypothetical protein
MGVSMIPQCSYDSSICKWSNNLAGKAVYFSFVQSEVGPAGYYRDQYNLDTYRKYSTFLADLNNENTQNDNYK